jgi:hypothetical protein
MAVHQHLCLDLDKGEITHLALPTETDSSSGSGSVGSLEQTLEVGNSAGSYSIDMNGNQIYDLADPVLGKDAVNKDYVDTTIISVTGDLTNYINQQDQSILNQSITYTNAVSGLLKDYIDTHSTGGSGGNQTLQQVTDLGATTSNKVTFENNIVLMTNAPSASAQDGEILYFGGDLFFYDAALSKFLSAARVNLVFSHAGNNLNSMYLKNGEVNSLSVGLKMPRNGTIIKASANSKNNSNVIYQIRKNGSFINIGNAVTVINTRGGYNNYLNVNFNAGDEIQIYMNVTSGTVNQPVVFLEAAWRL